MKTLRLDEREIHTLLAALSWWTSRKNPTPELRECVETLAAGEGDFDALTDEQVNALMDRIAQIEEDGDDLGLTQADIDEYRARTAPEMAVWAGCPGAGRCHGSMRWCDTCGDVGDVCDDSSCMAHHAAEGEDFIEAHAEPGSLGAALAESLDRPRPREVIVVSGVRDLREVVPDRFGDLVPAPIAGKEYVLVLDDNDPILGMIRAPEPEFSFSCERAELARVQAEAIADAAIPPEMMGEPGSLADARTSEQLFRRGPFLGEPVPEPAPGLASDWRERRVATDEPDVDPS